MYVYLRLRLRIRISIRIGICICHVVYVYIFVSIHIHVYTHTYMYSTPPRIYPHFTLNFCAPTSTMNRKQLHSTLKSKTPQIPTSQFCNIGRLILRWPAQFSTFQQKKTKKKTTKIMNTQNVKRNKWGVLQLLYACINAMVELQISRYFWSKLPNFQNEPVNLEVCMKNLDGNLGCDAPTSKEWRSSRSATFFR